MKPKLSALLVLVMGVVVSTTLMAGAPLPEIPKGKGEKCVEPTEVMRKSHMNFILHQRDETMHFGIRTKKHSLKECISCHVQPDENGKYPDIHSRKHFCNSCHSYAAVSIDCFQCHATHP